jgi:hypothetical protein
MAHWHTGLKERGQKASEAVPTKVTKGCIKPGLASGALLAEVTCSCQVLLRFEKEESQVTHLGSGD